MPAAEENKIKGREGHAGFEQGLGLTGAPTTSGTAEASTVTDFQLLDGNSSFVQV